MKEIRYMFLKAAFFFILGVTLSSLFVWTFIQGIFLHNANPFLAFAYYFVAFASGIAALVLYLQARSLFHYAKISE